MPITFTKTQIKRAVRLYKNGGSLTAVALALGVSMPTIRRILVEADVTIRGRGRPALIS